MSDYIWPDPIAILDELNDHMAACGQSLHIKSHDDITAGFERAKTAEGYLKAHNQAEAHTREDTVSHLAALLFEGLATRHPLVDVNKRLAFIAMDVFLLLNEFELDAPEGKIADMCLAVITGRKTVADLAEYIRDHALYEPDIGA